MISNDTRDDLQQAADATRTAAKSVLRDGRDAAQDAVDSAREQAQSSGQALMDKASSAMSDVKDRAMHVASAAGDRVDAVKGTIADEGHRLAQNLRSAASDRADTMQGRVLDAVAGGVETVSETVREGTLTGLVSEVQGYARRNPGLFVAGAAILGFAVARFMQADNKRWDNRS